MRTDRRSLTMVLVWGAVLACLGALYVGSLVRDEWLRAARLQAQIATERLETARQQAALEDLRGRLAGAPVTAVQPLTMLVPTLLQRLVDHGRTCGVSVTHRAVTAVANATAGAGAAALEVSRQAEADTRSGLRRVRFAVDVSWTTYHGLIDWLAELQRWPVTLEAWRVEGTMAHLDLRALGE